MIIKVISTQHPGNYYIEDTKNLSEKHFCNMNKLEVIRICK